MNVNNNAIKRIMADVKELAKHPSPRYSAAPLEHNVFEWHFSIRGPTETDFEGGTYHGRILLPAEYPFKPPNIIFLTKTGRFEVGTKICLSISAYHEESWQPAWGVRTMLEAIISFLPSEGAGSIGSLEYSKAERQKLAKESVAYCCPCCGPIAALLSDPDVKEEVDSEVASQISQLRMASALSPGKGPSDPQQAANGEGNQEGRIGNNPKAALKMSNNSDTHTCSDAVRNEEGFKSTGTKYNITTASDLLNSAKTGESAGGSLVSNRDIEKIDSSSNGYEDALTAHTDTDTPSGQFRDPPCCSAHTGGIRDTENASQSQSTPTTNMNASTSADCNADDDADSGSEPAGTDHANTKNVGGALSSTAAPTSRAADTLPNTETGFERQYDLTDRVLTALLYVIGALILFIICRRALLLQLYNGKDDPGQTGGEL